MKNYLFLDSLCHLFTSLPVFNCLIRVLIKSIIAKLNIWQTISAKHFQTLLSYVAMSLNF
jgi:hypothetical protein